MDALSRHELLLGGIYAALDGDKSRPADAIRAVLLAHLSHPAPEDHPDFTCAICIGTGTGLVDGRWVHCCCDCPVCSCGQVICDDGCDTVETLADAFGVVVHEPVTP